MNKESMDSKKSAKPVNSGSPETMPKGKRGRKTKAIPDATGDKIDIIAAQQEEYNHNMLLGIPDPESDPASSVARRERIRYVISRTSVTQSAFAEKLGIDTSNLSRILSGKIRLSQRMMGKISKEFHVSHDWLMTGQGKPFDDVMGNQSFIKGTPVYDIDVTAGNYDLDQMFTVEHIIGFVNLPKLSKDALLVHVSGDSMEPEISNGTYIAIRPVDDFQSVLYGQIYVVVTEDFRRVKYLRRNPNDSESVILHSANPNYEDIIINKQRVKKLFRVDAILNCKICG